MSEEDNKRTIIMRKINKKEIEYFRLVNSGDVEKLKEYISQNPGFEKNALNYQGRSALHVAICNQDIEIVRLLISYPDVDLSDCVLHAVATGNARIASALLDALKSRDSEAEFQRYFTSADYSRDMTPLMLAAQKGDPDMILLLLRRKHTIPHPHPPVCRCKTCKSEFKEAGADFPSQRLNLYRSLSNPVYICLTSSDPILSAFRLDEELKKCAKVFQELRNDYLNLAENLRQFSVDMLSQCPNLHEVERILKLKKGAVWYGAKYPRLQTAIAYDQKEFVAHPGVQQIVAFTWHGEWVSWRRIRSYEKVFYMLLRITMLPFIAVAQLIFPQWKWSVKWRCPLHKFLNEQASFTVFVFLVFALLRMDTERFTEGPPNTGLELPVVVWIIGFIWSSIRRLCLQGFRQYSNYWWNRYDLVMQLVYLTVFGFWFVSLNDYRSGVPREMWPAFHWTLVHEALLVCAAMMTLVRTLYYYQQDAYLGPLQRSLLEMIKIVFWVLLWVVIIICSFAIALTKLYSYYNNTNHTDPSEETKTQSEAFKNLSSSMMTLFWALFGMADRKSSDIIVRNENKYITHNLTQAIGTALFGAYHILVVIVFVNILIAILIDTFQKVQRNSDKEWKFLRTKQCALYLQDSPILPSPFNLIPNGIYFGTLIVQMMKSRKLDKSQRKPRHILLAWLPCCYIEAPQVENDNAKQKELTALIVQRYLKNVVQKRQTI